MLKNRLKSLLRGSWESLLAVALVGAFALVFMALFTVMFPAGPGLVDLYGQMLGRGVEPTQAGRGLGGPMAGTTEPDSIVATLVSISRSVKKRSAEAIEWTTASEGMPIHNNQAIQTLARSGAVVAVGRHDEMTLGENTLAVFTRPEVDNGQGARQSSLLLIGGEIRGKVSSEDGADHEMTVHTAAGATIIVPGPRSSAQFVVSVSPDKSSTFSLIAGSAKVNASGKTMFLSPNQAVTVDPSGAPGQVEPLPASPESVAPADHAVAAFGRLAPRVEFSWTEVRAADGYRLVLARDEKFKDVVLDKRVAAPRFVHGSLEPGRYFWKVGSLKGNIAGLTGPVRELQLARDTDPPGLALELPGEVRDPAGFVVKGRTEPGSQVFIDKHAVPVSGNGEFQLAVALRRGVNMIVIEAVDAAGNSSYEAKYVNGKF